MGSRALSWLALAATLVLSLGLAADAASAPGDPAARGLDVFVHLPDAAGSLDRIPIQVLAYGFATVRTISPLGGASVEAVWDPETLGPDVARAPEPVKVTTEPNGRAHFELVMPAGPPGKLRLLVGLRFGEHERTRSVEVSRVATYDVTLQIAEPRVVPGSTISAWVLVHDASSRVPMASVPIELSLLEGGIARSTAHLSTDATGSALGRVAIPLADAPGWQWTLRARVAAAAARGAPSAERTLVPRDETPGTPTLHAEWVAPTVRAGDKIAFVLRLRDAADEAVAAHPVRYWIGPKGTRPPEKPEAWQQASTLGRTDPTGEVRGEAQAPSTVAPRVGTLLQLVARTELDGQELRKEATVPVGKQSPSVELLPEGGAVIGGIEQRLLLRARDERDAPVRGSFRLEGDGLGVTVTTNAEGEADLAWSPPRDLGALRRVGPCAEGVAATVAVRPLERLAAFGDRLEPFQLCLPVDRDAPALLRLSPPVVRAGDKVQVKLLGAAPRPWSVVLRAVEGAGAVSMWLPDGAAGGEIELPTGASGLWTATAVAPGSKRASEHVVGTLLVRPKLLPVLEAEIAGGRAAPRSTIRVKATLSDGHGNPAVGAVAAVVQDLYGGGSLDELWALDTRRRLCAVLHVPAERCAGLLEADASWDPVRRALLGAERPGAAIVEPAFDPGANVEGEIDRAFEAVVHSLEGAVLEATASPEQLRDVRRKEPSGRYGFNPEMWTLVTAAMDEPPTTPGGEPFALADLVTIDPEVSFDNVARRVTRLKLFRALAAVRANLQENGLGPDEPALRDPAALLRRMVRVGRLSEADLLDPWGGTMQFVKSAGPGLPFLSIRGYELRAPGPDGRIGTADDVRDPFERVLTSGSPYAKAVSEDQLVDARLDMQVSEATVSSWQSVLESLTGTALGEVGTIGHGAGTGTGQGFGSGHGRLGASHRSRAPQMRLGFGLSEDNTAWIPPTRTDAAGKVMLDIPLGSTETTWRVALIGIPDGSQPAVAMLDVPVSLPLSARVDAGAYWIEGDQAEVRITVRNRSAAPARATLGITASGAARLVRGVDGSKGVDVPAHGAAEVRVGVRTPAPGQAALEVRTRASGSPEDVVRHAWQVRAAGELTDVAQLAWVERERTLELPLDPKQVRLVGGAELVLERGQEPALAAALDSLEPDRQRTPAALGDALDAAMRVRRWAIARGGEADPLAARALDVARRALGRITVHALGHGPAAPWKSLAARASREDSLLTDAPADEASARRRTKERAAEPPSCPPSGSLGLDEGLAWLELEQAPVGGVIRACWDALGTNLSGDVLRSGDPAALARLVLSMADEAHHADEAKSLAARLRAQVSLRDTGYLELEGAPSTNRASRALIYAALLRAALLEPKPAVPPERLVPWLLLQRDASGGFGSPRATRAALQALLAMSRAEPKGTAAVTVVSGEHKQRFELGASDRKLVRLDAGTGAVVVRAEGGAVLARLVRRRLRPWSETPPDARGPIHVELVWPQKPVAGEVTRLKISLAHDLDAPTTVDLRVPLPAGAQLAHPVNGVRQVRGVLTVRRALGQSSLPEVLTLPLRFSLAGRFTVPEAEARLAYDEAARAVAPARPLVVR